MVSPALEIVFTDNHLVVVLKPAGLLTTPAHGEESLVDRLNQQFFGRHDLAPVHRLDRQTSGLLVFARSPAVATALGRQFAVHSIEREYVAIVSGYVNQADGMIRTAVGGKRAISHFKIMSRNHNSTTIAVRLETGRRNQIRIHFAGIGHPILGDSRFDAGKPHPDWPHTRIALHARLLGFQHPVTLKTMCFEAEIPAEFQNVR